jgi:Uma2 family endonuclease
MRRSAVTYRVDPNDPRAPPSDVWARMSPAERQRVVDSLPSEFPRATPPEGDEHFTAKIGARSALGGYFTRIGRRVYLACEMAIYYPGEVYFAPDVMAVLDVETHKREKWTVETEGRGIDFALEVIVSGRRRKDLEENVERYARLGIPECFVFDRPRLKLAGFRLPAQSGKRARKYTPILPQGGRYASQVLGLDLAIEENQLRFFHGTSALLEADEMIRSLESMLDSLEARAQAAEERAAEERRKRKVEARKRKEELRRREEVEQKLAEALAEIERLKRRRER